MALLSNIEKGALVKLFNRGGYVLDFSTVDFDAFTLDSVGVALCTKYGLSKGKSLNVFISVRRSIINLAQILQCLPYFLLSENVSEHIEADVEALPSIAARLYRNDDIGIEGLLVAGNGLEVVPIGIAL